MAKGKKGAPTKAQAAKGGKKSKPYTKKKKKKGKK